MFGTPSLSARCDSVTIRRSANPLCRLTPPPTSTAYFSRKRSPGVVRRGSRERGVVPLTPLAEFGGWPRRPPGGRGEVKAGPSPPRRPAAGRGWGAGAGCGTGAGRGGIPGGRPAVRQGEPRPRIVGRGNGMIGTPGASGGCAGGGCGAGGVLTTGTSATGWLRGTAGLGRVGAAEAVFRAAADPFLAGGASFGRAGLAVGFPLAFEVVTRPFAFERRSELRGAPLPIPRYRSI